MSVCSSPYIVGRDELEAAPVVFERTVGGRRVFVKKTRPLRRLPGRWAQNLLYRALGNPLLAPGGVPEEGDIAFEVRTLRELAERGQRVPEVLHAEADYFVMSDAGPTLESVLKKLDDPEEGRRLVDRAARALARLHAAGGVHGGALARNLTVSPGDGGIGFIDFEECPPAKQLDDMRLRDLFLLLFSLHRLRRPPDFARVCACYDGVEDGEAARRLRAALLGWPRLSRVVEWGVFRFWRMSDIRALAALVRQAAERR